MKTNEDRHNKQINAIMIKTTGHHPWQWQICPAGDDTGRYHLDNICSSTKIEVVLHVLR